MPPKTTKNLLKIGIPLIVLLLIAAGGGEKLGLNIEELWLGKPLILEEAENEQLQKEQQEQEQEIAALKAQIDDLQKQLAEEQQKNAQAGAPASEEEQSAEKTGGQAVNIESQTFKVISVVDGDTIKLENGQTVRYIGIDTPETVHPFKPVECFGKEASAKNKELVEGKTVRLEKDISETDRYGRLLRYVYVGDVSVNDYLVRNGFASAVSYPPDVKYQEQFNEAEKEARENKRGLWADNVCEQK